MKGWECPKCGRVYAPHIPECGSCNPVAVQPGAGYWPNAWRGTFSPVLEPPYKVGDFPPFGGWATCGNAGGSNGIDRNVHAWN